TSPSGKTSRAWTHSPTRVSTPKRWSGAASGSIRGKRTPPMSSFGYSAAMSSPRRKSRSGSTTWTSKARRRMRLPLPAGSVCQLIPQNNLAAQGDFDRTSIGASEGLSMRTIYVLGLSLFVTVAPRATWVGENEPKHLHDARKLVKHLDLKDTSY